LFAHQDDEIFALPYILNADKKLFIYLTNGVSLNSSKSKLLKRSAEAKAVFKRHLSGLNCEVAWWGLNLSVSEGELYKFVSKENISQIIEIIEQNDSKALELITTTFEGAHHDHDASAVIAREVGKALAVPVTEISTYPQRFSKLYSFKVMKPQDKNDRIFFSRGQALLLALKLMMAYRSQKITWLGLAPATISTYLFRKYYSVIPIEVAHISPCFYETRGRAKQRDVLRNLYSPI